MSVVGNVLGGSVLLGSKQRKASVIPHLESMYGVGRTNGGNPVRESLLSSGRGSDDLPPVGNELVSSRSVGALGEELDGSDDLDGGLEVEVERVERLGLQTTSGQSRKSECVPCT